MSKSLTDALEGNAWSVSKVAFDLNDMLDDEGRPISERRADATVRAGVEMDMRVCPYSGIRNGQWMNKSALTQVSNYYNPVMAEIVAFRGHVGGNTATWADILAAVMDQLASPAIQLLQKRDARGPVSAQVSVGHKLAAGFFGVTRNLHERLALGENIPVTAQAFLDLMDETGALVGTTEVCAGSPQMIRKATTLLVEGGPANDVTLSHTRLEIARCLALQFQLGIFWRLYDRLHVWELLRGETRQKLIPYSDFLARKLEGAAGELGVKAPAKPDVSRLPLALDEDARSKLSNAFQDEVDQHALQEDMQEAMRLLSEPGAVISYEGDAESLALRIAQYLYTHRLFEAVLGKLELQLRELLGFPVDTPISLGTEFFPIPRAMPWYEMVVGRRVGDSGRLTGSSTGIRVQSKNKGSN